MAHDDLAVQAAGVRHLRCEAAACVGLGLADVVEEGAGHDEVAVDGVEPRRHAAGGLGHDERVLEEAVPVGVVVAHGGRRDSECRAGLARAVEGALEERAQVRLFYGVDEGVQALGELHGADRETCTSSPASYSSSSAGRRRRTWIWEPYCGWTL